MGMFWNSTTTVVSFTEVESTETEIESRRDLSAQVDPSLGVHLGWPNWRSLISDRQGKVSWAPIDPGLTFTALVLMVLMVLIGLLTPSGAHSAGKPPPPPPPPPAKGCTGDFPALAYVEVRRDRKGKIIAGDIVLTNATADKNCRIVVSSSTTHIGAVSLTRVTPASNNDRYHLAWVIDPAKLLVADFTVGAPDSYGVRSITETIPLQPKEVFQYTGSETAFVIQGMDLQHNQLVFGAVYGPMYSADLSAIYYLNDLDACLAQASIAPVGQTCVESISTAGPGGGYVVRPVISDDGLQVYYEAATPGNSESGRTTTTNISFRKFVEGIDGNPGNWSEPQVVMDEFDLDPNPNTGVHGPIGWPHLGTLNGKPALAYNLDDVNSDAYSVLFVELDQPMVLCQPESCVDSEHARLIANLSVPNVPNFLEWWNSNLLVWRNGSIASWDPVTKIETTILSSGNVYQVDPVE